MGVAAAVVVLGCGGDEPGATGDATDGGTSAASASDGRGSSTPSSTDDEGGDVDGSGSSGGEPPSVGAPAGGVSLVGLIGNQAVDIELAVNRFPIDASARVGPIIADRGMLVRADYALDARFSARTLVGRLTIEDSDGTSQVHDDVRMVTGPADLTKLDGSFRWQLEPGEVPADARYWVGIFEPEGVESSAGDPGESRLPASGTAELGAWGDRMVLDVTVVPFACPGFGAVEVRDTDLHDLEAFIFNTYPVQALNVAVHEVVTSDSCSEFDAAEFDLPALREAEGAPPWVYYGGLMPGDGGGYSIATEGGDQMDYRRTFASHTWRDFGLTFDLFAHELGHNHGREHTFEDPQFPGDATGACGGRTTRGFGIESALMPNSAFSNDQDIGIPWIDPTQELLAPTDPQSCSGLPDGNRGNFNDMMSYQYPYWVSAYTYAALAERVRTVSAWAEAGVANPPPLRAGPGIGIFDPPPPRYARVRR